MSENKAELVKWKATLVEQLEKILPLDEGILAELVNDEKSTEEDVTAEIGESARLVALDEKLNIVTGTPPPSSEGKATSSVLKENQENGHLNAVTPATQKSAQVKLPKLEVESSTENSTNGRSFGTRSKALSTRTNRYQT